MELFSPKTFCSVLETFYGFVYLREISIDFPFPTCCPLSPSAFCLASEGVAALSYPKDSQFYVSGAF